jgi:non-specific serine/threonine protein kinase
VSPQPDGDYRTPALNRLGRLLAAGHGGQVLLSAAIADHVRAGEAALPPAAALRDLGEHRLRDLSPEHVYQLVVPDLLSDFPRLTSLQRHRHNLPPQLTSFVGRTAELAQARELLDQPGVRLVTLTGPGGTGKSRLAVQLATAFADQLADGVWFVALAAVSEPALVAPAIAHTLGVRESGGQTIVASLAEFLEPRETLLVLDNFEHLLDAAPEVAELLRAAPQLKVLVTSRSPLRLSGEHELPIAPLPLPDPGPPAALLVADSVTLFLERARAIRPDLAVGASEMAAIAAICRRLDGLPLAIELAAARIRLLPPAALLERLTGASINGEAGAATPSLSLLTGGARDLPARQRTMRDAIAWSFDLMPPAEQARSPGRR